MKTSKNNLWIAFVINVIILVVVMLMTEVVYETNDDFALSCRIADGDPKLGFVNYFLCIGLVKVQTLMPSVNVFVLVQIVSAFACFVLLTKVFLDLNRGVFFNVISIMSIVVFSFDHYGLVQFTKTSALLTVVGMLILVDCMLNKRHWAYYFCAVLMIYVGASFRIYSLAAAVGFAGLYLIFKLLFERKEMLEDGLFKPGKLVSYALIFLLLCGTMGAYVMSEKCLDSDPEFEKYNRYNDARGNVVDYPVYNSFVKNEDLYADTGLSENDVYLIDNWYLDYNGAATEKNLVNLNEVYSNLEKGSKASPSDVVKSFIKGTKNDITNHSRRGSHLVIMIIMAVLCVVLMKPRYIWYILAVGISTAMLYLMLYYAGRPIYRATYMADVGCIFWLLYYCNPEYFRVKVGNRSSMIAVGLAVMATFAFAIPMYQVDKSTFEKVNNKVISDEFLNYTQEREDTLFVCSLSIKRSAPEYAHPLVAPGSIKNIIGTGSWGTFSPYIISKINEFGVEDCYKDAIDSDRICFVENKNIDRLEEYFNKWYGGENVAIHLVNIGTSDGNDIWKIVRE